MKTLDFNINDYVYVKLTDKGRSMLKQRHDELFLNIQNNEYTPVKEDSEGWSKWQLWTLMQALGYSLGWGIVLPFETKIKLEGKEET